MESFNTRENRSHILLLVMSAYIRKHMHTLYEPPFQYQIDAAGKALHLLRHL